MPTLTAVVWLDPCRGWTVTLTCHAVVALSAPEAKLTPGWAGDVSVLCAALEPIPQKPMCDVVVFGSAHPPKACQRFVARLSVVDLALSMAIAHGGAGPAALPAGYGVQALGAERTWREDRVWVTDRDASCFQLAPAAQRVAALDPRATIELEHLHPAHAVVKTRLPGIAPRVHLEVEGLSHRVAMRCDTLCIDTDHQQALLVWRGHIEVVDPTQLGHATFALEENERLVEPAQRIQIGPSAALPFRKPREEARTAQLPSAKELLAPPLVQSATPFTTYPAPAFSRVAPAATKTHEPAIGVLAASDAARAAESAESWVSVEIPTFPEPRIPLELLWLDASASEEVQRARTQTHRESWTTHPLPALRDAARPLAIMRSAALEMHALDGAELAATLESALAERSEAPFVVVAGELTPTLAPRVRLEATIAVLAPFAATHKALRDATEAAQRLVGCEWCTPSAIAGAQRSVERTAERESAPLRGAGLTSTVEQLLVDRRAYREKTIAGEAHLEATIDVGGEVIPTYLPAPLRERLPLFTHLRTRIVARLASRQDHTMTHPLALLAVAVFREVELSGVRRRAS